MPRQKKTNPKPDPAVVSLDSARRKREAEEVHAEVHALIEQLNAGLSEIVQAYHAWEAANPEKAVTRGDKLEMVTFGFLGPSGLEKCHEEHRVPGLAVYGAQSKLFLPSDAEIAERVMCPALEHGTCLPVLEAMGQPPCLLLGGELQQLLSPGSVSSLTEAIVDSGPCEVTAEDRKRARRAAKLVQKHDKLEEKAERERDRKRRK